MSSYRWLALFSVLNVHHGTLLQKEKGLPPVNKDNHFLCEQQQLQIEQIHAEYEHIPHTQTHPFHDGNCMKLLVPRGICSFRSSVNHEECRITCPHAVTLDKSSLAKRRSWISELSASAKVFKMQPDPWDWPRSRNMFIPNLNSQPLSIAKVTYEQRSDRGLEIT